MESRQNFVRNGGKNNVCYICCDTCFQPPITVTTPDQITDDLPTGL